MVSIACPSCGSQGKVPDQILGKKIKCQVCGVSFQADPAKAEAPRGDTIEVEGLDATSWVATAAHAAGHGRGPAHDGAGMSPVAPSSNPPDAGGALRQYKVLTQKDKWFEGKFDLCRLEEALNHYAGQGWAVRAMSTPHVMGFSGGPREEIVVLLERPATPSRGPS